MPYVFSLDPAFIITKNTPYNLSVTCTLNDIYCSTATNCNLTSYYSGTTIINSQTMDNDGQGKVRYLIPASNNSMLGEYQATIFCTNGVYNDTSDFSYLVTQTGSNPNISQSVVYFIIIALSVGLFLLCLYGAIVISWSNGYDLNGIIKINYGKYIKLFLIGITWFLFLAILWMGYNISTAFFYFNVGESIFRTLFYALMTVTFPIVIVLVFFTITAIVTDKKMKKLQMRNLKPR